MAVDQKQMSICLGHYRIVFLRVFFFIFLFRVLTHSQVIKVLPDDLIFMNFSYSPSQNEMGEEELVKQPTIERAQMVPVFRCDNHTCITDDRESANQQCKQVDIS